MRFLSVLLTLSLVFLMGTSCAPEGPETNEDDSTSEPVVTDDSNGVMDETPSENTELTGDSGMPAEGAGIPGESADGASLDSAIEVGEGLFDYRSKPGDWPVDVPVMNRFTYYEYENSDGGMHAFAIGNAPIDHVSSFYDTQLTNESGPYGWVPDPYNESIVEGDERILYYAKEGRALAVEIIKIDDTQTSLDVTLTTYD